jgi:hypothetical protein
VKTATTDVSLFKLCDAAVGYSAQQHLVNTRKQHRWYKAMLRALSDKRHKSHGLAAAMLSRLLRVAVGLLVVVVAPSVAQFSHAPMHVGVRCQDDFQGGWAATIDTYSMCGGYFIPTIRNTDWVDFYFNLHGAKVAFQTGDPNETCNGCGGADSVDFFLMNTHGGNWSSTDAVYGMWDWWSVASSANMRLGEAGQQLKIFATYACDTFQTSDGHFVDRWAPAFQGGLKIGLGAHDLVYDGNSQKGWEFAARMQNGEPIGQSWLEAVWYADNDNHPSVANTGVDSNDCWNRMGMDLESVQWLPALRDWQIGYYCWAGWNGD